MASESSGYRRFASGDKRTWVADDHLLRIRAGLFRENYSRLYWADIRAALLYRMEHVGTPILLAEAFSVALVVGGAVLVNALWGTVAGVLFACLYGAWRLTRPRWAVQLFTAVSEVRFPLTSSFESSRRMLDDMRVRILTAQQRFMPVHSALAATDPATISVTASPKPDRPPAKHPRLILYALLFLFGLLSGLTKATVALYCLAFLMMSFVPRDFDFPLSVRSAILLNQVVSVLRIALWSARFMHYRWVSGAGSYLNLDQELTLASIVFSLFGLMVIAIRARQFGQETVRSSTVLGLGSPAA